MLIPIHLPKSSAENPSKYQNFNLKPLQSTIFYSQTHQSTKIWCSKPIYLPTFRIFWEYDPPIYLHQPFKTYPFR